MKHPMRISRGECPQKRIKMFNERSLSKQSMIESINRAVREKRHQDLIQQTGNRYKKIPLEAGNETYNDMFKKLIQSCQPYFTSEYGKDEHDYRRFVNNSTQVYETALENENIAVDRIQYYKKETEHTKRIMKLSTLSFKRSKQSCFRFKPKFSRYFTDMSRLRIKAQILDRNVFLDLEHSINTLVTNCNIVKKLRGFNRKRRFSKRTDGFLEGEGEIERSPSELSETSSDEGLARKVTTRRSYKPFVFKLSDPAMKIKGITANYKIPLRMVTFPTLPANPLTYWFQPREELLRTYYPNNRLCTQFEKEGDGVVYYKNGDPAITFTFGKIGPLIIVSSKTKCIRGKMKKIYPVALFDLRGNGVVYDSRGYKRLIYDQAEGILIDSPSKIPLRWKWNSYKQVMCRRAELQFVPPTNLNDFDYDEKLAEMERKMCRVMMRRKARKQLSSSSKESIRSRKRKSNRSSLGSRIFKNRTKRESELKRDSSSRASDSVRASSTRKSSVPRRESNRSRGSDTRRASDTKVCIVTRKASGKRTSDAKTMSDAKSKRLGKKTKKSVIRSKMIRLPSDNTTMKKPSPLRKSKRRNASLTPKLLKFVGKGFIIKPILTPCHEILHISTQKPSSTDSLNTLGSLQNQSMLKNYFKGKWKKGGGSIGSGVRYMKLKRWRVIPELKVLPLSKCKPTLRRRNILKPIVMRLTDNVSLTIMDQQHIHIDFSSYPMHYMFSIGVKIITDRLESTYDIKEHDEQVQPIPSVFEVLKKKCRILYSINETIKQLINRSETRFIREKIKKLKMWGHDRLLGKFPICELMDNHC